MRSCYPNIAPSCVRVCVYNMNACVQTYMCEFSCGSNTAATFSTAQRAF